VDLIVIGGGAAGLFAAITAKTVNPSAEVILLEKSAHLLTKVKISGGGRCNVTHACFDPLLLAENYPRGGKELISCFHRFQPKDTIDWFQSRGVLLKTEPDGRIFPVTNRSETIIDCLLLEAKERGVDIRLRQTIKMIRPQNPGFELLLKDDSVIRCDKLLLATGSNAEGYIWAEGLGHSIQKPIPSLFTFNVPTSPLKDLSGITIERVELQIEGSTLSQEGPLLITHFGFSGPAVLKLSAWGARYLYEKEYHVKLIINWLPLFLSREALLKRLLHSKEGAPQKSLLSENPFGLPKSLWGRLIGALGDKRCAELSHKELHLLSEKLHADPYSVEGKTTHKEEFVTCGGISLKEVDFRTMQSKRCPGLFFAGEILDIDAITGGFNFQNAWTGGFIAGSSIF
jgi:predicted Rossmann fold flavoprotein